MVEERRRQPVVWSSSHFPQNRATWWAKEEATAWIATRSLRAVEVVTRATRTKEYKAGPLAALYVEWALAKDYQIGGEAETLGGRLGAAACELNRALQAGELQETSKGLRSTEVRRRWPSAEGQGRGKGSGGWSGFPHHDPMKIEQLVALFLKGVRDRSREDLEADGFTEEEISRALKIAANRIFADNRLYARLQRGLPPEQAKTLRANWRSWARPRPGPIKSPASG